MWFNQIKRRKEISEFTKYIDKISKPNFCLLCNKYTETLCNSHIVPQFILKEIADNGKVTYGQTLFNKNDRIIDTTKGISTAFTFKLVCRDCDKKRFNNYENPRAILEFDEMDTSKQKKILTEMAIKTHLAHISMKVKTYNVKANTYPVLMDMWKKDNKLTAYEIDVSEHRKYISNLSKIKDNTKFPYLVIYNKLLDYKTNIATQTIISYIYDLQGNKIYNPKDFREANKAKYFYLMILPYKEKTRVLFYIENKYVNFVSDLINDFNQLSDDEKLHFLFISLILHDEQFFINPLFSTKMKKDKSLIKLYQSTEISLESCKRIVDYKKYKNYLDARYSGKDK